VTVTAGPVAHYCTGDLCDPYSYIVTASGFLPDTVLMYTCTPESPGTYTGPETDGSGSASFATQCTGYDNSPAETISVTDGTNTAQGTYTP
jgi:hypothetical protein